MPFRQARASATGPRGLQPAPATLSGSAEANEDPMADERKRKWNTAGGVGVILVTGLAALGESSFFDGSWPNTILAILALVLTVGGAWALARFVARHGDEIGEARFDTRNKDEHQP